jgi:hypothetical protein
MQQCFSNSTTQKKGVCQTMPFNQYVVRRMSSSYCDARLRQKTTTPDRQQPPQNKTKEEKWSMFHVQQFSYSVTV